MDIYIKKRIKSIAIAAKGCYRLITTEDSVKVQLAIGGIVSLTGLYIGISPIEWMIQTLIIAIIISLEGLNTAIEKTADFIHPNRNAQIGFIKDIAAGAVFVMALAGVIVGCLIYIPKLF